MADLTEWDRYQQLIVSDLKRIEKNTVELAENLARLRTDIAEDIAELKMQIALLKQDLRFKSGVWGFAAGSLPVVAMMLYRLLAAE